MTSRKPVLGIIGGIGSGKSLVAAEFARRGGKLIAGDRLGHEASRQPDIRAKVASPSRFGQTSQMKGMAMVVIKFPDVQSQDRGVGFLMGRFSGRLLGSGEVIVPEAAMLALARANFTFTVLGRATYDQMAAIRGDVASPVQ